MKKKTIAIVSISLVLAFLAISVIATFPSYLFEDNGTDGTSSIQSGNVTESVQGDDVGNLGGDNGVEGILPDVEETVNPSTTGFVEFASADGVTVKGETNAFQKGTKVEIDELGIFDKTYYRARHYVRDFADDYVMFDITAEKDGKSVTPDGIVKVVFTIPDDFESDEIEVYYLLSNGVQKLNCTVDKTTKTATATLTQPGVFILIDKDTAVKEDTSSDVSSTESGTSSDASSDASSDSSSTPSDMSSDSSGTSSDSSTPDSSETPSEDPNKETMDGWTPWY